jgi:actin-related protein
LDGLILEYLFDNEKDSKLNISDIIIDNGTGYFKAGLVSEDKPRVVFPSYIG